MFEEIAFTHSRMSSTVINMLPTSLQSRLPTVRSIRKSVSMQTISSARREHARSNSGFDGSIPPNRLISESTEERMSLVHAEHHQQQHLIVATAEKRDFSTADHWQQQHQRPQQQHQAASPPSSIEWSYASQGLDLLNSARSARAVASQRGGSDFERKAFLDGVDYILKALPPDLNEQELQRLRTSVPNNLIPPASPDGRAYSPTRGGNAQRSILHRGVQSAVVNIFILIHLTLPYVLLLLRLAVRTEREYKISENLVGAGMDLANTIGSKGMKITGALCNVGDGKVGQVLTEAIAWTIEGVTGGLSDGVGQGLTIVGAKRQ
ncbi:hypothetical protein C8035_v008864 [Colletotrichum spinosum]|uniref:Uncharacterized protein n=1 Tax=Colletotrichum spinosum TaxID=1347390 RepID=A0A4V3HSE2_9PEZI|nr:hypothetical protein C8035_v008864 [Colletotrichum spinosum]